MGLVLHSLSSDVVLLSLQGDTMQNRFINPNFHENYQQNWRVCSQLRTTSTVAEDELLTSKTSCRSQQLSARAKDELSMSSTKNRGHQRLQRSSTATEVTSYQGQLGHTGLERVTKVSNKLTRSTTNCSVLQLVTKFTSSHFMKYVLKKYYSFLTITVITGASFFLFI